MQSLLKEKAIRFWFLLNETYKLEAAEQQRMVATISAANAEPEDRQRYLNQLQDVSDGIMPLDKSNDYSGLDRLKQEL